MLRTPISTDSTLPEVWNQSGRGHDTKGGACSAAEGLVDAVGDMVGEERDAPRVRIAPGVGHRVETLRRVGDLLGIESVIVTGG